MISLLSQILVYGEKESSLNVFNKLFWKSKFYMAFVKSNTATVHVFDYFRR